VLRRLVSITEEKGRASAEYAFRVKPGADTGGESP
jgi:hypothetical protein